MLDHALQGLPSPSLDLSLLLPSQLLLSRKVLGQRKQPMETVWTELRLVHPIVFTVPVRGSCMLEHGDMDQETCGLSLPDQGLWGAECLLLLWGHHGDKGTEPHKE